MLAIAGGKGGCGKTTTAIGVGAALPGRALAVDADWDLPNLHRLAAVYRGGDEDGNQSQDRRPSSCAATPAIDPKPVRIERLGGVKIVPAPETRSECDVADWLARIRGTERGAYGKVDGGHVDNEHVDSGHVDSEHVDCWHVDSEQILVDCPAGASPDATAPLSVADATLLVTTPQPAAIRDTMKTAAMARTLDSPPVGTLVVGADSPPDGIQAALDAPVVGCIPTANPPVLDQSGVASAYRAVAKEVTQDRRSTDC